ncbi:MAG: (2Fe-2S) ferredoxin domain-containing protein [Anaerolineaceae bacterium]|nr:(2Fe-2S) ferredoxin domain-containing protein [Anaerolineaceae bacterium]
MAKITNIEDLKRVREEALRQRMIKRASGEKQIIVSMGTSGIAAGARETMSAILEVIEKDNLAGVIVTQTGNLGADAKEPIVQVIIGEEPRVIYGDVTPEVAVRIVKEHVEGGEIVKDFVIETK